MSYNTDTLTDPRSETVKWLSKKKFWLCKRSGDKIFTHLSMDGFRGGMVNIPPGHEREFLELYCRDVQNGFALFFLEARTPIFTMFLDVDPKFILPISRFTPEQQRILFQIIVNTIKLFYPKTTPPETFLMVACTIVSKTHPAVPQADKSETKPLSIVSIFNPTPDQNEEDDEEDEEDDEEEEAAAAEPKISKAGNMHLHFPYLKVTDLQATLMGKAISCKLETVLGKLPYIANDWADIIDSTVYMKNGLRMVGAHKCAKCPSCKGRKCSKCGFMGRVDLHRVYAVSDVIYNGDSDSKRLGQLKGNFGVTIASLSIRRVGLKTPTPNWKRFAGCPTIEPGVCSKVTKRRKIILGAENVSQARKFEQLSSAGNVSTEFAEDLAGVRRTNHLNVDIDPNSHIFKICEAKVRAFNPAYANVQVRSLKTTQKFTYFRVCVRGEGSSFCTNLINPSEHQSNTVYFIIKASGVYQKCWCTCEKLKNRKGIFCKNYMSGGKALFDSEVLQLFPHTKNRRFLSFGPISRNESVLKVDSSLSGSSSNQIKRKRKSKPDAFAGMDRLLSHLYRKGYVEGSTSDVASISSKKRKL
jgi:hypothetical protein